MRKLACILLLVLVGCGKDRTLQDYNNEKVGQDLEKIKSVSGTYSGALISKNNLNPLGAMSIVLEARTRVSSASGDSSANLKASLGAEITIQDSVSKKTVSTSDGAYDSSTGGFTIQIPIAISSTQTESITVSGQISQDHLVGVIEADHFANSGGQFDLVKNAPAPSVSGQNQIVAGPSPGEISIYKGTARTAPDSERKVTLTFLNRASSNEEDFLYLLSPIKYIDMAFTFDDAVQVNFFGAYRDTRRNMLVGEYTSSNSNSSAKINVSCSGLEKGALEGWSCTWFSMLNAPFQFQVWKEK